MQPPVDDNAYGTTVDLIILEIAKRNNGARIPLLFLLEQQPDALAHLGVVGRNRALPQHLKIA